MAETLRVSLGSATAVPLLRDVASTTERAMPGHPDDLGRVQNWGEQYDALILEHTCQCTSQGSRKTALSEVGNRKYQRIPRTPSPSRTNCAWSASNTRRFSSKLRSLIGRA